MPNIKYEDKAVDEELIALKDAWKAAILPREKGGSDDGREFLCEVCVNDGKYIGVIEVDYWNKGKGEIEFPYGDGYTGSPDTKFALLLNTVRALAEPEQYSAESAEKIKTTFSNSQDGLECINGCVCGYEYITVNNRNQNFRYVAYREELSRNQKLTSAIEFVQRMEKAVPGVSIKPVAVAGGNIAVAGAGM